MKAFFLKIKDGAKNLFFSSFFVGVLVSSIIFTSFFIFKDIKHAKEMVDLIEDVDAIVVAERKFHGERIEDLEQNIYELEIINASHRDLIKKAGEMIFKYRSMIQQLVDEINRLNGDEPKKPSRSEA